MISIDITVWHLVFLFFGAWIAYYFKKQGIRDDFFKEKIYLMHLNIEKFKSGLVEYRMTERDLMLLPLHSNEWKELDKTLEDYLDDLNALIDETESMFRLYMPTNLPQQGDIDKNWSDYKDVMFDYIFHGNIDYALTLDEVEKVISDTRDHFINVGVACNQLQRYLEIEIKKYL